MRALVIAALLMLPGCASAPRSVQQIEQMDAPQFEAWLLDVSEIGQDVGVTVAVEFPEDVDEARKVCGQLDQAAAGEISATTIQQIIRAAGWKSPHVQAVLMIAAMRLNRRGGLPGGARGAQVLHAIATSVREGLDSVEPRPSK